MEKALTPFIDRVKALLGERVKDVRSQPHWSDRYASDRSTDADEMSTSTMAKPFAAAGQKYARVKYIFETHRITNWVKRAGDSMKMKRNLVSEWVELLLDQALLAERGTLEIHLFIRRMNQLLVS